LKRFISLIAVAGVAAAGSVFMLAGGVASAQLGGGALPVLKLALNGKTVKVSGATVSGAVTVRTTVTKEPQGEPTLAYLKPGVTPQQAFGAVAKAGGDLNALAPYGAIVFDADANKGTSSAQTVLQPGNYLALDTESNANVPPNASFTVTKSAHPAKLPKPAATVSTIEFGFTGPTTLRHGSLVRFQNLGYLVHMDVYVQVKNVKNAQKVIALLKAGKDKAAQKLTIGPGGAFAGPVSSGAVQQEIVTAKPGIYVQACFMTTQDGREHTQLGMERMFKVVK
jgi:hypothetical protein